MSKTLYFEDFEAGQQFTAGPIAVSKDDSIAFARVFDPQYFHTDEEAAQKSIWGRLTVSGWHTAAVSMRLKTESGLSHVAGGLVGMGIDSMKWPRPTYPGDALSLVITVLEKRVSNSRPEYGIVKYRAETLNQNKEIVMTMTTAVLVPKR